jgi:hypothetical protein
MIEYSTQFSSGHGAPLVFVGCGTFTCRTPGSGTSACGRYSVSTVPYLSHQRRAGKLVLSMLRDSLT